MHWLDKRKTVAQLHLEKGFQKDVHKEFMREYKATNDMLKARDAYDELYAYAQEAHPELYGKEEAKIQKTKAEDLKKVNAYLYDWADKTQPEKLAPAMKPWIYKAGTMGGQSALNSMTTGVTFNLRNKQVVGALAKRGTKITGQVSARTLEDLRDALYNSYMEVGMSPYDVKKRILGLFEETYENRAWTIARTETAVAQSEVSKQTYVRNGFKKKKWIATIDDRTRYSHRHVTKKPIPFDEPFILTDEYGNTTEMQWAHEIGAPAREVINCRCSTVGVANLSEDYEPTWTGQ